MPRKKKTPFSGNGKDYVLLCKNGDDLCWQIMLSTYLPNALFLAKNLMPEQSSAFQQCDVEERLLVSIMNAVYSYKEGIKGFHQYMMGIYRNELYKLLVENGYFYPQQIVSLNDSVPGTNDTLVFEDVLADKSEDPASFCDALFAQETVVELLSELDEETIKIVKLRLQNIKFKDIAKELGMSYKMVRERYLKYEKEMSKRLSKITTK